MAPKHSEHLAPFAARSESQIIRLRRTISERKPFYMLVDVDYVVIAEHPSGEEARQTIRLPRAVFQHFASYYFRPQRLRAPLDDT